MSKKAKRAQRKVVTFDLVSRSVEDPLSGDPNAPQHVLLPKYRSANVTDEDFERLAKMMAESTDNRAPPPPDHSGGIGPQFNKFFLDDPELDDGKTDYSKFFRAIDEGNDDGVFIAPDGSVHDLKKREIDNVDIVAGRHGFSAELFGAEIDPSWPKLVDDTDNPLASGMPLDLLLAMDEEDVDEMEDDFIEKALALENAPLIDEEEDAQERAAPAPRVVIAKSRVSEAPSHMSRISHRSEAMDLVEERVEHLLNTVYNDEEEAEDEEEEDGRPVDWNEIVEDFKKFTAPVQSGVLDRPKDEAPKPVETAAPAVEQEEEEEKKEEEKKKPQWDCQSYLETLSTTESRPNRVRDDVLPKKKEKKAKEEEPEEPELVPPEMQPKPGETKEEAKARKKAIKEYNRLRRQKKKETKEKFAGATKRVKKSIAASGGARGQRIVPLD